jgi:hypothetical protein
VPRTDSERSHVIIGAVLISAMGVYAIAAPVLAIALETWWPILIGLACLTGLVCFALVISMLLDSRKSQPPKS